MFVALSRFTIANGMAASVREAFVNRPHAVDDEPGFLGLSVMNPIDRPEEIWLLTRWLDESSYRTWHGSHSYRTGHAGIPKGLKLVPKSAEVSFFDAFAD
ncbi:MAG: antibiotic biosynthesis monooxygenase [bacterium]